MSYSCKDLANCIKYFPGYKLPAFKADLRWSLAYYYIVLKEGKSNAYKRVFNFSIYCLAEVWSVYIKRRKNCDLSYRVSWGLYVGCEAEGLRPRSMMYCFYIT